MQQENLLILIKDIKDKTKTMIDQKNLQLYYQKCLWINLFCLLVIDYISSRLVFVYKKKIFRMSRGICFMSCLAILLLEFPRKMGMRMGQVD